MIHIIYKQETKGNEHEGNFPTDKQFHLRIR